MIDLSFLPFEQIIPMLVDDTPINVIQSTIKPLYYDKYDITNNEYIGLSAKSEQDYNDDLNEIHADSSIPYSLQYRIHELWRRFMVLRENRDLVEHQELFDAFLLLCVVLYERILLRRLKYVSQLRDETLISST